MNIRHTPFITVLAVSGSLFFSGCGDKGPSEADFKKEANAACRAYKEKSKAVDQQLQSAKNAQDAAAGFAKGEEAFAELATALAKVKAPKNKKTDFQKLIDLAEKTKDIASKAKTAASSGDQQALQAITKQGEATGPEVDRLADKLGLADCGK